MTFDRILLAFMIAICLATTAMGVQAIYALQQIDMAKVISR